MMTSHASPPAAAAGRRNDADDVISAVRRTSVAICFTYPLAPPVRILSTQRHLAPIRHIVTLFY